MNEKNTNVGVEEPSPKCTWEHTPNKTPYIHPTTRAPMSGFPDEWTIACIAGGTLRIEPRKYKHCPYCGKEVNWKTDPTTPGLPNAIRQ